MPITLSNTNGTGNFTLVNNTDSGNIVLSVGEFAPPSPPPPVPNDPTLQIWYDGADSTQFQPNGNNGTNITQWNDKSATAHNAAPVGNAATRPMVSASVQNSKSVLYFDGGDGLSANMGTNLQNRTGSSIIVVFRPFNTGSNQQIVEGAVLSGGNYTSANGFNLLLSGSNGYRVQFASGSAVSNAPLDTNFHIHTLVFDGTQSTNATKLIHRVDSTQRTLTFTQNIGTQTSATINSILFGVNDALTNNLTGYIGEVLVYTKALTSTEIVNTEGYLKLKWGIT